MTRLSPAMRPKVKRDTFFVYDPKGEVYFRNNEGAFRLEGRNIHQWIEQLMPVFDGASTMEDLTEGLPDAYQNRIYDIVEVLYNNGFLHDVSQDEPDTLPGDIRAQFAHQIEFLNHLGHSGAHRFELYRQSRVLAVGSGSLMVSLVSALVESGLPKVSVWMTEPIETNWQRLMALTDDARARDREVQLTEVARGFEGDASPERFLDDYDVVLYVSETGDIEALNRWHDLCRVARKPFFPALCVRQLGLVGPLTYPESQAGWPSLWRRIHEPLFPNDPLSHAFSAPAGAVLANVLVFEWFKAVTGVAASQSPPAFYLLNLETLEGDWHSFLPHPLAESREIDLREVTDLCACMQGKADTGDAQELLPFFDRLTAREAGIFHAWEEGTLTQIPLAQCAVQPADPLSQGPVKFLSNAVCSGQTHEEARRYAGLTGVEVYASRWLTRYLTHDSSEKADALADGKAFMGVGAGTSVVEAMGRGLQHCLTSVLNQQTNPMNPLDPVVLHEIRDERCQYYLQSLTSIAGHPPAIGLDTTLWGFPIVWVGAKEQWTRSIGLSMPLAIRQALQDALHRLQNPDAFPLSQTVDATLIQMRRETPQVIDVPPLAEGINGSVLQEAMERVQQHHLQMTVFDLAVEPFMKTELAGVFGVVMRGEAST